MRAGERLDLLVFDPGAYGPALRRYGTVGGWAGGPGGCRHTPGHEDHGAEYGAAVACQMHS
jgi:hypothetical protein